HDRMKDGQASAVPRRQISKPHVLILSPHSAIAEGLVRLLSLDGRYDARRASTLAEMPEPDSRWQADVVLVDGSVLRNAPGALSRVQGAREVRGIATVGKTYRVRLRYADAVPLVERLRALKEFRLRVIAQTATIVQVLVD